MKCDQQKSVPNFLCLNLYDLGANKPSPRDIILLVGEGKTSVGMSSLAKVVMKLSKELNGRLARNPPLQKA